MFYWIEFLANICYPEPMIKFIKKIKKEIEKEGAEYLYLLVDGYLSYCYFLIGDSSKAREVAFDVYKKANLKNLKKEIYLSLKIISLTEEDKDKKEKYLKDLLKIAKETEVNQFIIEAIILNLKENFNIELVKLGDRLLKKSPFENLLWKFNLAVLKYNFSKKRLEKAIEAYNKVLKNITWEKIRKYFENQEEALELKKIIDCHASCSQ